MNKYGLTAIEAIQIIEAGYCCDPKVAWDKAAEDLFGKHSSGKQKLSPRCAFLGLCEEGMVRGIAPSDYCNSVKNKDYALRAVALLKKDPALATKKNDLWQKAAGLSKVHNNQMDVVLALWEHGLIK